MNAGLAPGIGTGAGQNPHLMRLSALLDLHLKAGATRAAELAYVIVNDTATILPYQQAALWRHGKIAAVSGVAEPDRDGPYARFLRSVFTAAETRLFRDAETAIPQQADAAKLGVNAGNWAEWFPEFILFAPLPDPRGGMAGILLVGRAAPWHELDAHLLRSLAGTYGLALAAGELPARRRRPQLRRNAWFGLAAVVLLAAFLFPVRSSVLAPAEIVAAAPSAIRAPFEGVIDKVLIQPNAAVRKGDVLITLDITERQAKAEVAAKAVELARAEYSEASQLALSDVRAKGRLAVLQGKLAQAQLELDYHRAMLARAEVTAPEDGVAVFENAFLLVGRPVAMGERVMQVAPPRSAVLEIAVPVADVVTFDTHAEVIFFPNIAPDSPVRGHLTDAAYAGSMKPDGVFAYDFRAALDMKPGAGAAPEGLRLGLKGTAKIMGEERSLLLWVLRRPIAVVREWLSL